MKRAKGITSFKLSDKVRTMLKIIAEQDGTSMTGVIESAVRQIAKERKIVVDEDGNEEKK